MKNLILSAVVLLALIVYCNNITAQGVAINNDNSSPDGSAMLDIKSENKGLLIPRIASWANNPSSPATGLLIYNLVGDGTNGPGFYNYNGSSWVKMFTGSTNDYIWNQFIDDQTANFRISGDGRLGGNLYVNGGAIYGPGVSGGIDDKMHLISSNDIFMRLDVNNNGSNELHLLNGTASSVFKITESANMTLYGGSVTFTALSTAGIVHNNSSGLLSSGPVALGTEVSGTLPVSNGGTGSTTFTGVLWGNGTAAVTGISPSAAGQMLVSAGVSPFTPAWTSTVPTHTHNTLSQSTGIAAFSYNGSAATTVGLTGQALALHNLATNGIFVRTGAGTVAARTITWSGNGGSVTNGDGVAGNPTIQLSIGTGATQVAAGNHAHSTLTRGTGLTGNNYDGSTATTWAVDFGNATVAGNGTKAQGNFGQFQPHATYTDFNTDPAYWGWNYVQGTTNAPNATSSQWYRQIVSLGSDYPARGAGGYSLEMAFPRFNTSTAGVWMRTVEGGTIGGWTRIDGGANVSGTTNYVAKFTSANVVGNSQIFDNGTNVGIGTATPSAKLHINGGNIALASAVGQTAFTLLSYDNANSLWLISPTAASKIVLGVAHDWDRQISLIYTPGTTGAAAGELTIGQIDKNSAGWTHGITKFYTNGGERMRIDASGNVGIGTSSPAAGLHLYQDRYTLYGPNSTWGAYLQVGGNGRVTTYASVAATNGNLHLDAADGGFATYINYYSQNNTYINAQGGNVGIGTASPVQKLHVVGQIAINDNNTRLFEGNGDALRIQTSTGYVDVGSQNASWTHISTDRPRFYFNTGLTVDSGNIGTYDEDLFLQTSGTTRVTVLNSNGNVGIGTSSPAEKLEISGGTARISALAGTGNRPVTANSSGNLQYLENSTFTLSGNFCYSPDDLRSSWAHGGTAGGTLTGDDAYVNATMPFSLVIEGVSYNTITICTNGWVSFGTIATTAFSNSSLPTSTFSNPVILGYWDDLTSADIRYGYVGTSPNIVYIIDFTAVTYTSSYAVNFQIQIHQTSGLINVKYREAMNAYANGQSATIGFQSSGGSSAKAYPITYNGKVLDDNRDDSEGWSVCPVR